MEGGVGIGALLFRGLTLGIVILLHMVRGRS